MSESEQPILVIGDVTFRRFAPYFRKHNIPSLLLSYRYGTEAHLADETHYYNEEMPPDAIIDLALKRGVRGVISRISPAIESTIVRDGLVKEVLEQHGIPVIAHSARTAAITADKGYTRHFLAAHGLPFPHGHVTVGLQQLLEVAAEFPFPCVIKAPGLANSDGVKFVARYEDLEQAFHQLGSQRVILEEFVSGEEVGIEVIGRDGDYQVFPPAWLGHTNPDCNPQRGIRIAPYPHSEETAEQIRTVALNTARALGLSGLLEIDMVIRDGRPMVVDLNGRPGGISGLSYAASGIDPYAELFDMALGTWQAKPIQAQSIGIDLPIDSSYSTNVAVNLSKNPAWIDLRGYSTHDILTLSVSNKGQLELILRQIPEAAMPVPVNFEQL